MSKKHRGRDHVLMVLIDHGLGGGVKDCWIAEGRRGRELRDKTSEAMSSNDEVYFEDIEAATLADVLGMALAQPPCPREDDQIEDVAANYYLTLSRAEHAARLAGP